MTGSPEVKGHQSPEIRVWLSFSALLFHPLQSFGSIFKVCSKMPAAHPEETRSRWRWKPAFLCKEKSFLVALRTLWCSHHYHASPELFHHSVLKVCTIKHKSPFPAPGITTILLSALNFTVLDTLFKWNHSVVVFCDWLISLSVMSSRFIHAVAYTRISFPFET